MSETNRRKFLAAAGAGAAAGVVGITAGPAFAGGPVRSGNAAKETVVAYVRDHHSSEVTLLVGEREVVVNDRDLATRILNAAGGE